MSFLYLTGSRFNVFGMGGTVSVSPAASSVAGSANLYDSDPGTPHIAGSIAADSYMRVQFNALTNPGFETSTLSGWTAGSLGTGTSAEEVATVRTGSKSLKLTGTDTSNYGSRYQSVTASAGEYRKTTAYIKTLTAGTAKIFIKNLKTGNYYNGSAWALTRAAAVSQAATGSFVAMTVTYQVESFDTCRDDTVSLQIEFACESGTVFIDDTLDVVGVTFAGIFGHNYGPVSPLVQSSDDGSAWTTRATMTIARPAFFSTFSIIYAEYWQIKLSGTNHAAPYTGEAVLGQYQTSTTAPKWGIPKTRAFPGVRGRMPSAKAYVYNFAVDPPVDIECSFSARTAAAAKELAEAIWLRSGQGLYPVIFVPIDTETDVYYGRLLDPVTVNRPFQQVYECTLPLVGDPFPTVGL